ncbi:Vacuolar protein sorting-associated protein 53 -like protein [Trametes pubescens]|uniref:Vacuolar protein sorting-associated protein 53-like protein n=1 Tax=Trametes pubescens TaxID=154538 RepID=A0A1M2W6R4_TRAPU|nr:Vacuolar protein sorting-associated protein 53 -like protein [Trametes pubescens]
MATEANRVSTPAFRLREDELPPELILSIERILDLHAQADTDPLDRLTNDFNSISVLNDYFPNEAALGQLEAVQARLAENERALQSEIDSLREELRRDQDPSRMQLIQEMISDLLGQMSRIREKATESEAVVRNITKEIQVLDLAKKNLILSMTTLKRLQMLVNVLGQLEDQIQERKYHDIVQSLAAVKQISASFKPYTSVQRIAQLWRRIQEIQSELRTMIDSDWDKFYVQDPAKPIKPSAIADACLVVDVLGPEIRTQFVDRYVALELKEYRRIFRATDEAGQLDNLSRRFAWFRRLLHTHETEQGRVFPAEWKVGWSLTAKFIEITRDDMTALLSKAGSKLTVKQLLDTLQETMDFESSITRKFGTSLRELLKATTPPNATRVLKPITSAFEPHMGVFIDAQDRVLSDMLAQYRGPRSRTSLEATSGAPEDDNAPPVLVLPSSTELFYFYAQTLDQCAQLFTGQPLYDLCSLFKKWLRIYAEEVLVASMKRPSTFGRKSMDTRYDVSELKSACTLINTADYCQTTALELEENIRAKCDEAYKEQITLQDERDLFVSAISAAIMVMLRELDSACDSALTTLSRTPWATVKHVSGQSAYVEPLVKAIEDVAETVKPLVEQKKYLRNFFDKAANAVLAKFTNALVKSRPLMETGAEQLLIDLQAIKACLLKVPGEALVTSNYTKSMTKHTTRLEALLKVIVTPVDPTEGFILNYTLVIGDASFSNFQKILDLKGTPKAEQNDLLDTFLTVTSTKTELDSTSFLSSLDMDPGQVATLTSPGSSRVSLLPGGVGGESLMSALSPPPMGGTSSSGADTPPKQDQGRREVFSDFKRFVSFGLRRETMPM